ncbi:E3 ubiquitin-protein ligase rnf168-like [Dunckerocampus dactyliophorus]|uniref:E3 ubiquitin-protein ligase rnf168-like n=1 Tax=Dunckerocampus dactyliophorus TaxID=161453 RepID=UPI002405A03D|nr:E3 ubiquitin-protein ligase rnf168-like [Dunckerocampus dactyliophorus]XP_054649450.1 E3 ubiquitin-protein ligase rnf168-like [Dunckerocampus dactyliophorus]XP_054649451.1 E3 ubiquitin-protein ligase rnf168-like [Dunckerocampus dactyliophorus]
MMLPDADAEMVVSGGKGKGKRSKTLSLDDCVCPVCLEMFLEPVTLPCTHTFCKECFLESVDKSTLCCPMCRKRVSTWARKNNKNKTLVNEKLWSQIQISFPQHCQRRLNGQDAVTEDDMGVFFPRVSQPGELKQEYQEQITKLTEEKRELDEEERRASEEYIKRLLDEEEQLLTEERRRREEDERLAKVLSKELNAAPVSQDNQHPVSIVARKKVNAGHIERFLCRIPSKSSPSHCSTASTLVSNKENILLSQDERLPQLDFYGSPSADQLEADCVSPLSVVSPAEEERRNKSHASGDEGPSSAKRKSSQLEPEADEAVIKRGRSHWRSPQSSTYSSSSCSSCSSLTLEMGTTALRGMVELEAELQSRRRQEEEDRQMALLLQQELNQEERQRRTDRRKGTADAYLLRRASSARKAGRDRRTPKTSPPATCTSSAPPSLASSSSSTPSRGSKQVSLTDMFPSLSS